MMKTSSLVVVLFAGLACAGDDAVIKRAAAKVKQIVAHRGSSHDRPENTLASYRRSIEAGATATEVDVRLTRDGALISLHDADVKRTSNGKGPAREMTLAELQRLDAGSWFDAKFAGERIPTLREVMDLCGDKIDILLDLQETGPDYANRIAEEVRKYGQPKRIVVGVRTLEHAKLFRKLLPEARQLGLIPNAESIEAFAAAGVETIRLWPRWLKDESLVPRVRKAGACLHLNGTTGTPEEVRALLRYEPESMSSDDPARLVKTLAELAQDDLASQAKSGLRRAVEFFRKQVSTEGGYLWRYSEDLSRREGEGKATATQVWVQPPGTPTVGLALLAAHEATGEQFCLDAARDAATALARGQLQSGGWDYKIEFAAALRKGYAYRTDGAKAGKNVSTLDDNTTQAALRLLMAVDAALEGKDAPIRQARDYALESLLKAQYPNGAWPQRFDAFPNPSEFPVKKAGYPEKWSRTFPGKDYRTFYTFNDNSIADVVDILLEAYGRYGDKRFLAAVEKAGDFMILAQMPEPQPAWAQQYDLDMQPAWARKFEPPSITGGESQGVMKTLMKIYRETGDPKFLEPIPRAVAYFRKSLLSDGRLARFYELKTNKPLYFTKQYELVYKDDDLPTHYGFKVQSRIEEIAKEHAKLKAAKPGDLAKPSARPKPQKSKNPPSAALIAQVKSVLAALDDRGRWVEEGKLRYQEPGDNTKRIIECQTFVKNIGVLSGYLSAAR